jgi:hypothetical protein
MWVEALSRHTKRPADPGLGDAVLVLAGFAGTRGRHYRAFVVARNLGASAPSDMWQSEHRGTGWKPPALFTLKLREYKGEGRSPVFCLCLPECTCFPGEASAPV